MGHARLEHLPVIRHARGAHGGHGHPMIRQHTRDDCHFVRLALCFPVETRRLERALGRLCPTAGKKERVDRRVDDTTETFRQLNGRQVRGTSIRRTVGQRAHLLHGSFRQLAAPVPNVDVPQTSQAINDLHAIDVLHDRPTPLDPNFRLLVVSGMVEGMDEMRQVRLRSLCRIWQCHK